MQGFQYSVCHCAIDNIFSSEIIHDMTLPRGNVLGCETSRTVNLVILNLVNIRNVDINCHINLTACALYCHN